jgi:hypothetical protein
MSKFKKILLLSSTSLFSLLAISPSYALTDILYNGSQGTPASQSWLTCNDITSTSTCSNTVSSIYNTGNAQETGFGSSGITLNTTDSSTNNPNDIYAGYSNYKFSPTPTLKNSSFPSLNQTAGILLNFTSQLSAESHGSINSRAGFSVIMITSSGQGIEIDFQNNNNIFAQGSNFTIPVASYSNYDTTQLTTYSLAILGSGFTLSVPGIVNPLLSGSLQTYNASGLSPNAQQIYDTPNLIFLGDNTSEASATVNLTNITLTTPYAVPWEVPGGATAVSFGSLLTLGLLSKTRKSNMQK